MAHCVEQHDAYLVPERCRPLQKLLRFFSKKKCKIFSVYASLCDDWNNRKKNRKRKIKEDSNPYVERKKSKKQKTLSSSISAEKSQMISNNIDRKIEDVVNNISSTASSTAQIIMAKNNDDLSRNLFRNQSFALQNITNTILQKKLTETITRSCSSHMTSTTTSTLSVKTRQFPLQFGNGSLNPKPMAFSQNPVDIHEVKPSTSELSDRKDKPSKKRKKHGEHDRDKENKKPKKNPPPILQREFIGMPILSPHKVSKQDQLDISDVDGDKKLMEMPILPPQTTLKSHHATEISCHDDSNNKENLPIVKKGETVWAELENRRYYKGIVESIDSQLYYKVTFDDGSFSDDLYPCHVTNYEEDRQPEIGAAVKVIWTDGITYDGVFDGTKSRTKYEVRFEDGSKVSMRRDRIYVL